jgi:hypothetical protein
MRVRIRFETFLVVRPRCSGAAHLVLSRRWETLIASERLIIICWQAGGCAKLFSWLVTKFSQHSPTLVANLWDVTDKDIDKFAKSVLDKLRLTACEINCSRTTNNSISVVTAVAQSRESCKLKYLTGAAPVTYGIPFYL